MNEDVAIESGGYVDESRSRINYSVGGCLSEKLRCCMIHQVF